ncbi:MAG: hypothetical protein AAGE89_08670 [Pseudomonadota bacterium]
MMNRHEAEVNAEHREAPFFVGYLNRLPDGLGLFLFLAIVGFIAGMGGAGFFLSASQTDPGSGDPGWSGGRQELIGRLEFRPYPVLRVPAADGEGARTYLLAGMGKRGAYGRSEEFDGLMVRAEGFISNRGSVSMMQVIGARRGLVEADEHAPPDYYPPEPRSLGKWQLTGEICDGKCYAGLMRPGTGLAHKACANLCLFDRVPAVFVSAGPVDGQDTFILANKDGRVLTPEEISPITALYLTAEGEVERIDDTLIFKMDMDSVEVR